MNRWIKTISIPDAAMCIWFLLYFFWIWLEQIIDHQVQPSVADSVIAVILTWSLTTNFALWRKGYAPLSAISSANNHYHFCGVCDGEVYKGNAYCSKCGQRLRWEEVPCD